MLHKEREKEKETLKGRVIVLSESEIRAGKKICAYLCLRILQVYKG